MFTRNASPAGAKKAGAPALSIIGPELVVSGNVATEASIHVEGRIDGNLRCANLCQGAGGVIAGDISAEEARIAGLVEGTVNARTLIVEASGRITGDVVYQTISIAAGAQIDGRLARREVLALGGETPPMLVATPKAALTDQGKSADLFRQGEVKRRAAG